MPIETDSPIHPYCFRCLQRFPLGGDDEVMSSTLQQFAKVIDEVRKHTNHQSSVTIDWNPLLLLCGHTAAFCLTLLCLSISLPPLPSHTLSSWVPVMLFCPPSLQMLWCFLSLSLKRETWKVRNTSVLYSNIWANKSIFKVTHWCW